MERDEYDENQPPQAEPADAHKQTDLAEGELATVEESIRAHERKGDKQGCPQPEKQKK